MKTITFDGYQVSHLNGVVKAIYRIDLPFPFNRPIEICNPRGKTWLAVQKKLTLKMLTGE